MSRARDKQNGARYCRYAASLTFVLLAACRPDSPPETLGLHGRVTLAAKNSASSLSAPLPPALERGWRLSASDTGTHARVRLAATRRPAAIFTGAISAAAEIPPGVTELRLWTSPPTWTATTGVPRDCLAEIEITFAGGDSVRRAIPAAPPGDADWLPFTLRRSSRTGEARLELEVHPGPACGEAPLAMAVSEVQLFGATPVPRPPNLLLVVVDALRRDLFDCTSEHAALAPALNRMCERGVFFENAFSTSSWTYPAVASMLTGARPRDHGAGRFAGTHSDLRSAVPTLPEILGWRGYASAAFVANPYAGNVLARGFDQFSEAYTDGSRLTAEVRRAEHVVAAAERWLQEERTDPFFLELFLVDMHEPVDVALRLDEEPSECAGVAPLPFGWEGLGKPSSPVSPAQQRRMDCRRALYRAALRYLDAQLAKLFAALERNGLAQKTAVIVLADHGEELWDHAREQQPAQATKPRRWGVDHGHTMYAEIAHVPLLIVPPAGAPPVSSRRSSALVSSADLFATALSITGTSPPSSSFSHDLSSALRNRPAPSHDAVLSEGTLYGPDRFAVTTPELRAIFTAPGEIVVFDRLRDPTEQRPLRPTDPLYRTGVSLLEGDRAPAVSYSPPLDRDREALRVLGYVEE